MIVLCSHDQRLDSFYRERLSAYKVPKKYHFAEELSTNEVGKVMKKVLREQFSQPVS
jgi:long-chain acyl-CoA synthetase